MCQKVIADSLVKIINPRVFLILLCLAATSQFGSSTVIFAYFNVRLEMTNYVIFLSSFERKFPLFTHPGKVFFKCLFKVNKFYFKFFFLLESCVQHFRNIFGHRWNSYNIFAKEFVSKHWTTKISAFTLQKKKIIIYYIQQIVTSSVRLIMSGVE